ncbi:MAG: GTPase, partial [Candidatus Electrothrix sp. AX2]|nr:GTPase [Candidatus Electrothrix gigas]
MGYEEALRLIEEAKETGGTTLGLHLQGLSKIPQEVFQLKHLVILGVGGNSLASLPSEIGQLNTLETLWLDSNQLSSLPSEFRRLTNLRRLYLERNYFSTLPPELFALNKLIELALNDNQLTSLPPEIVQLPNLRGLMLQRNPLTTLPPEIAQLPKLRRLELEGNPLTSPPYELAIQGIEAIREYFASAEEGTRTVAEVKVILVGEGASGKTSLTRCLRKERFNPHEETTHGIRIKPWQLKTGDQGLRCNLWDFGGQEIMHATHQ